MNDDPIGCDLEPGVRQSDTVASDEPHECVDASGIDVRIALDRGRPDPPASVAMDGAP